MNNDKNVKSGHRRYVTRTIKKARDTIPNVEETDRFRLECIRASLKEKSEVLKNLTPKF